MLGVVCHAGRWGQHSANNATIVSESSFHHPASSMSVISIIRFTRSQTARGSVCRSSLPCTPIAPALPVLFSSPQPNDTRLATRPRFGQLDRAALETARSTSALIVRDVRRMGHLKEPSYPVIRPASPAPPTQDFARQQVSKQQRSKFQSTSIFSAPSNTMAPPAVNQTNLHPSGLKYVLRSHASLHG
jgi:phosphoenolpyruvate carboxykinase (ATP)